MPQLRKIPPPCPWLPGENPTGQGSGVVLLPPAELVEELSLTFTYLTYVPARGGQSDRFVFCGTFRLLFASPAERRRHSAAWFHPQAFPADEPIWVGYPYSLSYYLGKGWRVKSAGGQVSWMEEKAGAEMALMLAETLPTDAFTQMGWPSSPAEIVEKWQEFVQTNRKHQAYLDTLFAAARGFTSRMAGFYPGQVPQSAFTTLESHLENIRWASIWQRSNSFDALYQSLNQLAAQFVDQTFLPAAGDSDQNTRWYKENWHLRHMEPGALVSPGISPALAAFLTLAELQAFAYGCGPVTTERVIATRDQYLLDHPSAIVLTSTP